MSLLYQISNVECKYPTASHAALKINSLDIKHGEIVFLIGASGVGKSTILETLGLMNNTLVYNSKSTFNFAVNGTNEDFTNIWSKSEAYLSKIRKKHLSFIFQSTNLFETLNVEDNGLITLMLQGNDVIASKNIIRPIFKNIFPSEFKELLNNRKISEMSGGQRQRLAFVRAIATDFSVMLADEPTGNLDWFNANNLMSKLIDNIKTKSSSAIIVTHDIDLAVKHANKIVLIEKKSSANNDEKLSFGLVSQESTFTKNESDQWKSLNAKSEMKDYDFISYLKKRIIEENS